MIVHQPDIPVPVLNFHIVAWATRGEEVDDQDLDKAAREFAGKVLSGDFDGSDCKSGPDLKAARQSNETTPIARG